MCRVPLRRQPHHHTAKLKLVPHFRFAICHRFDRIRTIFTCIANLTPAGIKIQGYTLIFFTNVSERDPAELRPVIPVKILF